MCVDKLTHIIAEEVDTGSWVPMRAGRTGPLVSHLMFADDLLLFGQATNRCMESVLRALDLCCSMSGQQVSREKTTIHFSKNVSSEDCRKMVELSGFKEVQSLGRYLGVLALGHAPKGNDSNYLVDQVASKLTGWKAKQLSLAGRITLSKSVIL